MLRKCQHRLYLLKFRIAGQVGLVGCNMRSSKDAHIGDTFCLTKDPVEPLKGFVPVKPMVFAGVYPMDQSQHVALRNAIEKLVLNDPAVTVAIDSRYFLYLMFYFPCSVALLPRKQ